MKSPFALSRAKLESQRVEEVTDDVHFPESLARAVITEYGREGDVVLDPFAGFGTTAVVALAMGRRAYDERGAAGRAGSMACRRSPTCGEPGGGLAR